VWTPPLGRRRGSEPRSSRGSPVAGLAGPGGQHASADPPGAGVDAAWPAGSPTRGGLPAAATRRRRRAATLTGGRPWGISRGAVIQALTGRERDVQEGAGERPSALPSPSFATPVRSCLLHRDPFPGASVGTEPSDRRARAPSSCALERSLTSPSSLIGKLEPAAVGASAFKCATSGERDALTSPGRRPQGTAVAGDGHANLPAFEPAAGPHLRLLVELRRQCPPRLRIAPTDREEVRVQGPGDGPAQGAGEVGEPPRGDRFAVVDALLRPGGLLHWRLRRGSRSQPWGPSARSTWPRSNVGLGPTQVRASVQDPPYGSWSVCA